MNNQIKILRKESYLKFIQKLLNDQEVYAPVQQDKRIGFQRIDSVEQIASDFVITDMSPKAFVFPRVEKLFSYTKSKEDVAVQDVQLESIPKKVILGIRPCDAMGLNSLRSIFEWEPEDPIFSNRMERTTFISFACNKGDAYCFCTSLGGGPGNTSGSDMQLTLTDTGDYIVDIVTSKGVALVEAMPELFEEGKEVDKEKFLAPIPKHFDNTDIEKKINKIFDTDLFDEYAMRCIGCGACAYVCPTCACFDIQDETRGSKGQRVRCWDSCGLKLFTLHTSGHNPRETQGARWRQRLMHKFAYMPERLNVYGCVGCGRCSRGCPVDMNIVDSLVQIAKTPLE